MAIDNTVGTGQMADAIQAAIAGAAEPVPSTRKAATKPVRKATKPVAVVATPRQIIPFGSKVVFEVAGGKPFKGERGNFSQKLVVVLVQLGETDCYVECGLSARWNAASPNSIDTVLTMPTVGRFNPGIVGNTAESKAALELWKESLRLQAQDWRAKQIKSGVLKTPTAAGPGMSASELGITVITS